jgi:kinesin family protein C2/C3
MYRHKVNSWFTWVQNAANRRYDAASWLRRTVGIVCARDLPEEPSEEEFRLGLRNGIVLCNALNKVQPGAIPKVVAVMTFNICSLFSYHAFH